MSMRENTLKKKDNFQEGELVERWSKIRILVGLTVLVFILGFGLFLFNKAGEKATQVLGIKDHASNTSDIKLPTQEDANRLLDQAKDELNNLTAENLTSSQAAIQKIIRDLQSLQGGDKQTLDVVCELVCK